MSFADELQKYPTEKVLAEIQSKSSEDVIRAIAVDYLRIDDFMALLSPAASTFLEQIAAKAHCLTRQRFGNNIQMYAPLYLSNFCTNGCLYCGFNATNKVHRQTLTLEEVEREATVLHQRGFRHILLVTGEAPASVDNAYLAEAARRISHLFSSISIEVYPMDSSGYSGMVAAGIDGLTIYQETYDRNLYAEMHPFGKKRDFDFRLLSPENGGEAGVRRIGIGALLGLGNFRFEGFITGLHALYLSRHYWRTHLTVSFPRMRPAEGGFSALNPVCDKEFVQLICALRLLLPDAGLVMSTRESAQLRDNLLPLGITQMSAGSCTSPGGYAGDEKSTRQFNIDDDRSADEVAEMIRSKGYEAVWKDWDRAFLAKSAAWSGN